MTGKKFEDVTDDLKIIEHEDRVKPTKPNSEDKAEPERAPYWTLDDIEALADPEWIVDGLIARFWKTLSFGESGTYKSHLAVDRYCRVAHGMDYHGLATISCPICFVANEDAYGLAIHRVQGWHRYHGKPAGRVIVIPGNVKLDRPEDIQKIIASTHHAFGDQKVGYVIDTWDRSLCGNPNEASTVNPALDGLDALLAANGVFTDTISHSPWSDRERTKGPVTFWANHDTRLKYEKNELSGRGTVKVVHHKNAAPGLLLTFEFEQFEFQRRTGATVKTLVPLRDRLASTEAPPKPKGNGRLRLTDTQHLAIEALRDDAAVSKRWDFSFADAQALWTNRDVISADTDRKDQQTRASRLRKQLAKRKLIRLDGQLIRLVAAPA
jgi:hypothetical protein